jgi:hypothetical protein
VSLRILLVLPAGERVRVTFEQPEVPRRSMLRFSVLPLTVVAALTPCQHHVRIIDENVEPLDFNAECDIVGITFMTALAPRAYEIAAEFHRRGKLAVAGGYRLPSWKVASLTANPCEARNWRVAHKPGAGFTNRGCSRGSHVYRILRARGKD